MCVHLCPDAAQHAWLNFHHLGLRLHFITNHARTDAPLTHVSAMQGVTHARGEDTCSGTEGNLRMGSMANAFARARMDFKGQQRGLCGMKNGRLPRSIVHAGTSGPKQIASRCIIGALPRQHEAQDESGVVEVEEVEEARGDDLRAEPWRKWSKRRS